MWCEMGSCISWHADPAALGEADTRARAIAAGWRIDALGRLACPQCQQNVNGQVFVPAGGQVKVPTPRVDQVLFRVVPFLALAWRMR